MNPTESVENPHPRSANYFHAALGGTEGEIDCSSGGRAAARRIDVDGRACWIGVTGDFVLGGSRSCDWDNPADLAAVAARVIANPAWPWRAGDGGMISGALYCDGLCYLFSDPVGSIPLFYEATEDRLAVGTRLAEVPASAGVELDPVGLLESYVFGWGIGERTVFRGVNCLPAGRSISWQAHEGARLLPNGSPLWRNSDHPSARQAEAACYELLLAATSRTKTAIAGRRTGVLLAGLDSRLIVALLQAVGGELAATYTHGGGGNRESAAAARVAALYEVRHIGHQLIPKDVGDAGLWEELFLNTGTMKHPQLITAGRILAGEGTAVSMTGAAGDILLGGSGYDFDKKRRALLALDIGFDVKTPDADEAALAAFADEIIRPVTKDGMWRRFLGATGIRFGPDIVEQIREDALKTLRAYAADGAGNILQIQERYKLEHRARFRAFGQERTLALQMPLLSPYFDFDLMKFCYNLHPMVKSERRMLRRMLLKRFRSLASIPVPNSLVPYTCPNPLFVFGKYLRLRQEGRNRRLYRESRGAKGSFSKGSWIGRWDRVIRSEQSRARFSAFLQHPWLKRDEVKAYLDEIGRMKHWIGNGGDLFELADLQLLLNLYDRRRAGR